MRRITGWLAVAVLLAGLAPAPAAEATSADKKLVAKSDDKNIVLSDAATKKEVRKLAGHKEAVTALAFAPDGKYLLSGDKGGEVSCWDLATGKLRWKSAGGKEVKAFTVSRDSKALLVEYADKTVDEYNALTGKPFGG